MKTIKRKPGMPLWGKYIAREKNGVVKIFSAKPYKIKQFDGWCLDRESGFDYIYWPHKSPKLNEILKIVSGEVTNATK